MMLYEAVHYQHSETWYDYNTKMRERETSKPKVQRTKSASNVQRFLNQQQQPLGRTASFVVGQKLRESKWFTHDELKVFCAVVENGFIVQRKDRRDEIEYGIVLWNAGQEKSKNPDFIKVYSLHMYKENYRPRAFELMDFWPEETKLRIYNHCDKNETPHATDVIRDQISYAESTKQKWHSTEHFTYWCRYGPIQINQRVRNMTDAKWGNFGLNAGLMQLKKRIRRITNSKQ